MPEDCGDRQDGAGHQTVITSEQDGAGISQPSAPEPMTQAFPNLTQIKDESSTVPDGDIKREDGVITEGLALSTNEPSCKEAFGVEDDLWRKKGPSDSTTCCAGKQNTVDSQLPSIYGTLNKRGVDCQKSTEAPGPLLDLQEDDTPTQTNATATVEQAFESCQRTLTPGCEFGDLHDFGYHQHNLDNLQCTEIAQLQSRFGSALCANVENTRSELGPQNLRDTLKLKIDRSTVKDAEDLRASNALGEPQTSLNMKTTKQESTAEPGPTQSISGFKQVNQLQHEMSRNVSPFTGSELVKGAEPRSVVCIRKPYTGISADNRKAVVPLNCSALSSAGQGQICLPQHSPTLESSAQDFLQNSQHHPPRLLPKGNPSSQTYKSVDPFSLFTD